MEHLKITFKEPFMSFGGVAVDGEVRPTHPYPTQSMLVGFMANALGWTRTEHEAHQRLSQRLVYSARIDQETANNVPRTEFQTVQLGNNTPAWTTRGYFESRLGDDKKKLAVRNRDYLADSIVTVALRLEPEEEEPDIWDIAYAIDNPYRPLFVGRKPFIYSSMETEFTEGSTSLEALLNSPFYQGEEKPPDQLRVMWPSFEKPDLRIRLSRTRMTTDIFNWKTRLHTGTREICEGVTAP